MIPHVVDPTSRCNLIEKVRLLSSSCSLELLKSEKRPPLKRGART